MRSLATVRKWDSQPRLHKFVVTYRQGGKRQVRYFKTEKLAKAFAAEKQIELLNEGRKNGEITSEERRAMMVAREKGFSLKDAVEHYATHLESLNHSARRSRPPLRNFSPFGRRKEKQRLTSPT